MNAGSSWKLLVLVSLAMLVVFFAGCTQPPATPVVTPPPSKAPVTTTAVTTAPVMNETQKAGLLNLTESFVREIDIPAVVAVAKDGPNSTSYQPLLSQIKAFKARDPGIAYVYLVEQKNGTVVFLIDANDGLPDGSYYHELYKDAPKELTSPVTGPIFVGPYTDAWGTFYSGFAPVRTGPNASVILIGVDKKA